MAKEGPLFAAEEQAPPAKAVVYIYWPREEQGERSELWIGPCDNISDQILPGGYTALVVEPGPSCFQAEIQWELADLDGDVSGNGSLDLGKVEFNSLSGHSSFVRVEQEKSLLLPHVGLRLVKPEAANAEIGKCRRSIPLSAEEIFSKRRSQ